MVAWGLHVTLGDASLHIVSEWAVATKPCHKYSLFRCRLCVCQCDPQLLAHREGWQVMGVGGKGGAVLVRQWGAADHKVIRGGLTHGGNNMMQQQSAPACCAAKPWITAHRQGTAARQARRQL